MENKKQAPENSNVQSEIQEYTAISQQRRRLLPRAALVGLFAGLTAALFRATLSGADQVRNGLIEWSQQWPIFGWIFPLLFSAAGAALSVFLVRRFAPETSGSGVPHLKAVLHRFRILNWMRVLPVKFAAGVLALGSGLALGREGPTVQMGGAVGDALAGWLKSPPRERRTLIASGAGAGLSAAFNAPISGLTFVLEEVQRDFHPIVFAAAFLAAVIADIVARILSGPEPVFSIPTYQTPPLESLPVFVLLGVLAGLLGVLFNRSLLGTMDIFGRFSGRSMLIVTAMLGALAGLIGWFSPIAIGSGHHLAELALAGEIALTAIPAWFAMRFFLTISNYGTGAAGGIFAPLLVLGALLGLATGQAAHAISPQIAPIPAAFAVVGMAAYFTAIVRAPLTGTLLIIEMTGNYEQMLPLLVSCFCAYAVAEGLRNLPIYEALLERDLTRNEPNIHLKEPMVVEFEIERNAPFAGKEVRWLGLPPGCVIVRCVMDGREIVPTAATRLEAHMKITVVVSPEAKNSLPSLRKGCKEAH